VSNHFSFEIHISEISLSNVQLFRWSKHSLYEIWSPEGSEY